LIRAHPWLEKNLENQPRIRTDLHGCEPRSISALFTIGLLLTDAESRGWVAPVCVSVGIEEAVFLELAPTLT
jgi:hypothetical protein